MKQTMIENRKIYYFETPFFEHDGISFKIIATESTGNDYYDCIHTVKNLSNNKTTLIEMSHFIRILNNEVKN